MAAKRTKEQNARYYANRTAKAKAETFSGYYAKRKHQERSKGRATRVLDTLDRLGDFYKETTQPERQRDFWDVLADFVESEEDFPDYWDMFREGYVEKMSA